MAVTPEPPAVAALRETLGDLLNPKKLVDPRDALRGAEAVRVAREVAKELELDITDAAGAAVLLLASQMDTGGATLVGEREKLVHCVAICLLQGTSSGQELMSEASWTSSISLSPRAALEKTYLQFRSWLDSIRQELKVGERRGPRVGLALTAARLIGGSRSSYKAIADAVNRHLRSSGSKISDVESEGITSDKRGEEQGRPRSMPIEEGDVPGSLVLARAQGANLDHLLRRGADGLRWNVRKARDLIETVTPSSDAVDGAPAMEGELTARALSPDEICDMADWIDKIAALGDDIDRQVLAGYLEDETDAEIGERLGISGRAVCKRRNKLMDRARQKLD